jgi:hypothetical protein
MDMPIVGIRESSTLVLSKFVPQLTYDVPFCTFFMLSLSLFVPIWGTI